MRGIDDEIPSREDNERDSMPRSGGSTAAETAERLREIERFETREGPSALRRRERIIERDREYRLRPIEFEALFEIGRFRGVLTEDLQSAVYGGNKSFLTRDLHSLREQRLIHWFALPAAKDGKRHTVTVLTQEGQRLTDRHRAAGRDDRLYAGFVKPREAFHNALLYRMYLTEARRIHAAGGRVKRILLDDELKQKVYTGAGKAFLADPGRDYSEHLAEAAAAHALPIVDGRVVFPDVRVEYEDKRGAETSVDLELTTEHYRAAHLSAKARAGFRLYAPGALLSGALRGRIREDPQITAEILAI